MLSPKYRADIDGLRAIAILSVVSFHAFPLWLKGGFVGVDIFFVLSGFLISKIILENLDKGSFSFAEFYSRRIKRIFPALIVVLISCYLSGWFQLLGDEYKQLGKHIAAGSGFIANFIFWQEAGYFDAAADTKPLLHLWSLGIEEQFYIIWPLLLWLAWKNKFNVLALCITTLSLSFGLNLVTVHQHPVAVFYSPATRFWELLMGSLLSVLSFYPLQRWDALLTRCFYPNAEKRKLFNNCQAIAGFLLISAALLFIDKKQAFPGWRALIPVSGTCLLIAAGPHSWVNRKFLSNRLLVWFGLISFPLYLWHWPLLSFARILEFELTIKARIIIVGISIALAWLTYRFIEIPVRFNHYPHRKLKPGLIFLLMLTGFTGYNTYKHEGFHFRLKDRSEFVSFFDNNNLKFVINNGILEKYRHNCDFYEKALQDPEGNIDAECYTPQTDHSLFIWGDSHAQHLYHGLATTLPKEISILQVASSACIPHLVDETNSNHDFCTKANKFALEVIRKQKPKVVILAQARGHEKNNDLQKISAKLKRLGVSRIIILGPVPQWEPYLFKLIARKYWEHTPKRIGTHLIPEIIVSDKAMKEKYSQNKNKGDYISLFDFFCNKKGCLTYLGNNKQEGLITFDYGHLSPLASIFLADSLLKPLIIAEFKPDELIL
ncbi:acyltransferase family protein [Legionella fairfieldensis]|uniref:acyltransferase family protein n=1 Tax=Legionella fairfieldensis TaxID=45064 RepID=UPI000567FEFA|nr:acyltransferase family protein [Legionella fairfieldensis]